MTEEAHIKDGDVHVSSLSDEEVSIPSVYSNGSGSGNGNGNGNGHLSQGPRSALPPHPFALKKELKAQWRSQVYTTKSGLQARTQSEVPKLIADVVRREALEVLALTAEMYRSALGPKHELSNVSSQHTSQLELSLSAASLPPDSSSSNGKSQRSL